MDYVPTTELEAVNAMLMMINEEPINSFSSSIAEAVLARTLLHRVSREIQSLGLHCNLEENYTLYPDSDGYIKAATDTLSVFVPGENYTMRGRYLYDRENHTKVFTKSVSATIITFLPFEDLPEHVRAYVAVLAARRFQVRMQADQTVQAMTEADEAEARVVFHSSELEAMGANYLRVGTSNISYRLRRV